MKEKGGSLNVQKALGMKYTNERNDYSTFTDAEYANARAVKAGNIASGMLLQLFIAVLQREQPRLLCIGIPGTSKRKDGAQPRRHRGEDADIRDASLQPQTLG